MRLFGGRKLDCGYTLVQFFDLDVDALVLVGSSVSAWLGVLRLLAGARHRLGGVSAGLRVCGNLAITYQIRTKCILAWGWRKGRIGIDNRSTY